MSMITESGRSRSSATSVSRASSRDADVWSSTGSSVRSERVPYDGERHVGHRWPAIDLDDRGARIQLDVKRIEHRRDVDRKTPLGRIASRKVEPHCLPITVGKPYGSGIARAAHFSGHEWVDRDDVANRPWNSRVRDLRDAAQTGDDPACYSACSARLDQTESVCGGSDAGYRAKAELIIHDPSIPSERRDRGVQVARHGVSRQAGDGVHG